MDRLNRVLKRKGIKLIVSVYPRSYHITGRQRETRLTTSWRNWAEQHGAAFLNLFPSFITEESPQDVIAANFIPCDVHWNAAGHARISDAFILRFPNSETLRQFLTERSRNLFCREQKPERTSP